MIFFNIVPQKGRDCLLAFYISMLETEQEREKMTEIYEEHRHALLKYAFKITSYNKEMAEDAVHNAFISIINEKEKYFHLDSRDFRFSSVIIVKNKCFDLLRKEKMYADVSMDELEIFLESNEKPIDEQVIISSEYAAIRKHMSSIDEISKQVLIMKYAFGMSYKEIGEMLNMTPKHVDTRIFRAKEKVRRLVENENSENDITKGMRANKNEEDR
jgi:RNA polymerase sigma-70 factor (ECF subfamily)